MMMAPLPPDRRHIQTEQRHSRSMDLDTLSTTEFIALMADDHRVVVDAVLGAREVMAAFIDALTTRMHSGGRLIYLGAGTSGRLGVLDASECPPTFHADPNQIIGIIAGGDAALRTSSEGKEDEAEGAKEALQRLQLTANDTVLGIAAGGTTPYVLGALRIAKSMTRECAMTGLLTCAAVSSPVAHCDHTMHLATGPEVLTGSTRLKAGSATKLALNIISTAVFTHLGKVYSNLMVDMKATNAKLLDRAIRILMHVCPELDREGAAALLNNCEGNLKAAIIMQRLDTDRTAAELLLRENRGQLRLILNA